MRSSVLQNSKLLFENKIINHLKKKTMKKLNLIAVAFLLSASLFGQSNKEDIDLIQSIFGKEKKEVVQAYMTIPEAQSAKFWSLYDVYETERKKLGHDRVKLIEDYATKGETRDTTTASARTTKKLAVGPQ